MSCLWDGELVLVLATNSPTWAVHLCHSSRVTLNLLVVSYLFAFMLKLNYTQLLIIWAELFSGLNRMQIFTLFQIFLITHSYVTVWCLVPMKHTEALCMCYLYHFSYSNSLLSVCVFQIGAVTIDVDVTFLLKSEQSPYWVSTFRCWSACQSWVINWNVENITKTRNVGVGVWKPMCYLAFLSVLKGRTGWFSPWA